NIATGEPFLSAHAKRDQTAATLRKGNPHALPVWKKHAYTAERAGMPCPQTVEKRRERTRELRAARIPIVAGGVYGDHGR
ncbi:MAG: hypothetical protein PUD50_14825, partial [Eubacteriales bacterium]|nr:hypothetical protein [Eubacteriales bacterium]